MKTLKLRIKDKHSKILTELATQVNFVWNYVNELSFSYLQKHQKSLSAYDIDSYTKGASKECDLHSQTVQAISEEYTTQTCSCCGAITDNSPKGRTGLRIREWTCSACNTTHDRDINAAKNILRIGRDTLVGGVLSKGDVNRVPADKGGGGNTTEMVAEMARDFEGLATKCATHYEELKNEAKLLEDIQ